MDRANKFNGIVPYAARPPHGMLVLFFGVLWQWRERTRQRRALLKLDDRMLSDIGVGRAEAEAEARKPFWLR